MLKQLISRGRSDLQLLYYSRLQTAPSGVIVNSLPKSGTHLVKAILEGMGYDFRGHYGSRSRLPIRLTEGAKGFYTAHTRKKITTPGARLLCLRDPAEVALSLVHYAQTRKDHYRNELYDNMSREAGVTAIFAGEGNMPPLAARYASFVDWAEENDATIFDFADVRADKLLLARLLGDDDADEAAITAELAKPNPTKRNSDKAEEKAFLRQFVEQNAELVAPCYEVYERAREKRSYAG